MFKVKIPKFTDSWAFSWRCRETTVMGFRGKGLSHVARVSSWVTKAVEASGGDGNGLAPGTPVSGSDHSQDVVRAACEHVLEAYCGEFPDDLDQNNPGHPSLITW